MSTRDEIDELKAATRAAHETIKDLNAAIRDAEELVERMKTVVEETAHKNVDQVLAEETRKGVEALGEVIKKACDESTEAVYRRFDLITGVLMGEDKKSRREGKLSLPELAEQITGKPAADVDPNRINAMLLPKHEPSRPAGNRETRRKARRKS